MNFSPMNNTCSSARPITSNNFHCQIKAFLLSPQIFTLKMATAMCAEAEKLQQLMQLIPESQSYT
jgi:hypothetical protein